MLRACALLLTVLTGFSGLVYEVAWEKVLATLLGSHSEATASVLGLFLGGLALGYVVFGRFTRRRVAAAAAAARPARLLVAYGAVEAAIGLHALLFPLLFRGVQALSGAIPHGGGGAGFALDVALSALLVGPPAVLMGGTIPILTQALAHDLRDATRVHAFVYGFNTAGAFAGALAAGFWLIPWLGLGATLRAMGVVNLAAGAGFARLGRLPEPAAAAPAAASVPPLPPGVLRAFALAALCVGFAMMTLQTVLIRLGALSLGASQFTFSIVVAVFVLSIALGSLLVSALPRIPGWLLAATLWVLCGCFVALYPELPDAPYWAHRLRVGFGYDPGEFTDYQLATFAAVLAVIGPPVVLSGAVLPLVFDHLRHRVADLGQVAGRLYGWNTFGSLLGALLGGYWLLTWLDLHHVFRLALVALFAAAWLVTRAALPAGRPRTALFALLPAAALVAWLPPWPPERLSSGLFRARLALPTSFSGPDAFFAARRSPDVIFYDDDPTTSVAIIEAGEHRGVVSNGKPDTAVPAEYPTSGLLALIPALLAPRIEHAFVVGWATGVTAGELARLRDVRDVVVAEISPAIVRAAPLFDFANGAAVKSPKVHIVQGDAYRTLLRSPQQFDLILSEPSNPWVNGVELLYTREFLEAARDRLAPGGVHAQWLATYETDDATLDMVLRTYVSVFGNASLWYMMGPDLLLVGVREPEPALDVARLTRRFRRPDFRAGFERCGIASPGELFAHELFPLGVLAATPLPGPVHTLWHPQLGYLAAHAFFAGLSGHLPNTAHARAAAVGRRNSLLLRWTAARHGRVPERLWWSIVTETCENQGAACAALLARWRRDEPVSPLRDELEASIARHPVHSRDTPLDLLAPLSWLYGVPPPEADGATWVARARQATELYQLYYHHAAPFSRRALARLWRRCLETEPEACAQALAEARPELEALGVDPSMVAGRASKAGARRGGAS